MRRPAPQEDARVIDRAYIESLPIWRILCDGRTILTGASFRQAHELVAALRTIPGHAVRARIDPARVGTEAMRN